MNKVGMSEKIQKNKACKDMQTKNVQCKMYHYVSTTAGRKSFHSVKTESYRQMKPRI